MNKHEYNRTYRIEILTDVGVKLIFLTAARNMALAAQVADKYAAIAVLEEDVNSARVVKIEEVRG